jgi:dihydrofolate reductase
MRKLKLQMQVTVDGYVAGPEGQLDWMTVSFEKDPKLYAFVDHLTDTSDTILLGRKMTAGFVQYWERVAVQKDDPEFEFAQKMVNMPKVMFSKTVRQVEGKNLRVESGDLASAVNRLKSQPGKDLLVYGGATFVSSLIEHGLIDDIHLFVNPVAIGNGMRIFNGKKPLKLTASASYPTGIVVNSYRPQP